MKSKSHGLTDQNEYRAYYNLNLTIALAALLYLVYDVFYIFLINDIRLIAFQTAGVFVCIAALIINRMMIRHVAIISMSLFVSISVVVWACLMDVGSDLRWYVAAMLFPLYFFSSTRLHVKLLLTLVGMAAFCTATYANYFFTPQLYFPYPRLFNAINDVIILSMLALELIISRHANNLADREFKIQLARMENESMRDPLTGLWNRRILEHRSFFKQSYINSSLAIIDIDLFKNVNDTYGHDIGDKLLKHLSDMLVAGFRRDDCIIRWGGEEFLVILSAVSPDRAKELITEFNRKVKEHPLILSETLSIPFTFTAGIAPLKSHEQLGDAICLADERLYKGKNSGRDKVVND